MSMKFGLWTFHKY